MTPVQYLGAFVLSVAMVAGMTVLLTMLSLRFRSGRKSISQWDVYVIASCCCTLVALMWVSMLPSAFNQLWCIPIMFLSFKAWFS